MANAPTLANSFGSSLCNPSPWTVKSVSSSSFPASRGTSSPNGQAPRIEQDDSQATYESWCKKEQAEIDWSKPVAEVYNLIRGTNPQPGAWTTHAGARLDIFDSQRLDEPGDAPGAVMEVGEEGVKVAAGGGQILVKRVRPAGQGKVPAIESGLVKGARLG